MPAAAAASPLAALESAYVKADPRAKVLATMALGVCSLHAALPGLLAVGLGLAFLLAILAARRPVNRAMALSYAYFVLLWMGIKLGVDLWAGLPLDQALATSGLLGLRLGVLLLLGLNLALSTSPRALGLGLASMLRPVMPRSAWQVALSLALFVHFLPLTWHSVRQARSAMAVRGLALPWRRRVLLLTQSLLRYWSQKTWKQTMGLACRGLDGPEAWSTPIPIRPLQWLVMATLAGAGCALLLLA